jgi:hypothetical protein
LIFVLLRFHMEDFLCVCNFIWHNVLYVHPCWHK